LAEKADGHLARSRSFVIERLHLRRMRGALQGRACGSGRRLARSPRPLYGL